ncbi:MAG TPA: DivIVA domain-containing protein [Acidimicrobiales bacterium]|nr:DivIVA domain-containing protein [Acidimicrobiales bacterium]
MDLTPEALRSARFREKLRGYHPDDVDAFLESVAEGLGVLLSRLRESTERARRVESGFAASDGEESVRRTLVLAQRTADMAIAEAREEASKLLSDAEARAASITGSAQDAALATAERAQEQLRADLDRLQHARDQLNSDVHALEVWFAGERARLKNALGELADRVDSVRVPDGRPVARTVDLPAPPTRPESASAPPRPAEAAPVSSDPQPSAPPPDADRPQARTFTPSAPPERTHPSRPARAVVEEPSPDPVPAPPPAPWIATGRSETADDPHDAPMTDELTEVQPEVVDNRDPDLAVLMRAQVGSPPSDDGDDLYLAELRRAITDPQPLGPREDDQDDSDDLFQGSVEDIFDPRRTSRLRRRQ